MKKIYETVFKKGEADRFGGQLAKICFVHTILTKANIDIISYHQPSTNKTVVPNINNMNTPGHCFEFQYMEDNE